MRKILYALASIAFTSQAVAQMAVCQKDCAIDYGKCMISRFDILACAQEEACCSLDCLKGVAPHLIQHHHNHHNSTVEVQVGDIGICQKDCGIESAKCLITTFDIIKCGQAEAVCALDCLKGASAVTVSDYDRQEIEEFARPEGEGSMQTCKMSCGFEFGKCLADTYDLESCLESGASCTQVCSTGTTKVQSITEVQAGGMGVCQKNCGIDYAKCLITKFDMPTCIQEEAVCALDCLKGVSVKHHHASPQVRGLKCSACKIAAGKMEGVINKFGCGLADAGITAACEVAFLGPEDPLAEVCALGFIAACPTFAKWIENKVFTTQKACAHIHMC